jgi:hypothetical protein
MTFRKLRIAWSVAWGVVALLLCVLWVRSYWWVEMRFGPAVGERVVCYSSLPGVSRLSFAISDVPPWTRASADADFWWTFAVENNSVPYQSRFWGMFQLSNGAVATPYWFDVLFAASLATLTWLPWWSERFSLRTLLIATTLVAAVLGLIVYFNQT